MSSGPEGIEWEIRPTSESALSDDSLARLAVRRERLLERYAEGIAADFLDPDILGRTSGPASLIDIWEAIRTDGKNKGVARWNSQTGIADRWGTDPAALSRDSAVLVALPGGCVVPLQFFSWKTENDSLVKLVASSDALFRGSITEIAKAVWPSWLPESARTENTEAEKRQRSAKDFVPWVRAARRHPEIVTLAQDQFRAAPARFGAILNWLRDSLSVAESKRVEREGGTPLGKQDRSQPVLHRALVGGI